MKKQKAQWAPSGDAVRSMLQQRKFTDLSGSSEQQGELSSIVMHKLSVASHTNNFPLAVGTRISGVDDSTYSITGTLFPFTSAAWFVTISCLALRRRGLLADRGRRLGDAHLAPAAGG